MLASQALDDARVQVLEHGAQVVHQNQPDAAVCGSGQGSGR